MSKVVLFDLDGTLLDTARDFTQVLNQLLAQYNQPEISYELVKQTVSDGARALIKCSFSIDESDERFAGYLQELLDLYAIKIQQTESTLFSGISNLLKKIETENCQWGIVTNKPSRFTTPLLSFFPDLKNAAVVICADELSEGKPSPEGLLLACKKLDCAPEHCMYVGDHKRDIDAGKNADIKTIAVNWGYFPDDIKLDDWGPDLIVDSPEEIATLLSS